MARIGKEEQCTYSTIGTLVTRIKSLHFSSWPLSRMPMSEVALHLPICMSDLATDQQNDPVSSIAYRYLKSDHISTHNCRLDQISFETARYTQLWSQLTLHESVICRRMKSPGMSEEKLLIVVPKSQWKSFLNMAHEDTKELLTGWE